MTKAILTISLLCGFSGIVFANNVTDDLVPGQSPEVGSILYYGTPSGNSQGTWALPESIPGLQGPQGEQGIQGEQGLQGIQGEQGVAGLNGLDGLNGEKGDKGDKGDDGKDVDPATVNNLQTQITNNTNATDIIRNNLKATNKRVDSLEERVDNLEETKVGGEVSIRLADDKYWTASIYDSFDVRHHRNDMVGIRLMFKAGKSYEEELIEKQQRELVKIKALLTDLYLKSK